MGYIYFLQTETDSPLFKIGYTGSSIEKRMQAIQTACPYKLHLYASMLGTPTIEAALHKQLAKFRTHGEWFRVDPSQIDGILAGRGECPPLYYIEILGDDLTMGWLRISDGAIFIPLWMFSHDQQVAYFATCELLSFKDSQAVFVNMKGVEEDYTDDPEMIELFTDFRLMAYGTGLNTLANPNT